MKESSKQMRLAFILAVSLCGASVASAQAPTTPPQQSPAPAQAPADKPSAPQVAPLTLDSAPPPVNAEEEAAIKIFRDAPKEDSAKKGQIADEFLQKYPQGRYRAEIYSWQVQLYLNQGQIDKMEAAGDKELEITPNDPLTLAIIGSTLPRAMNSSTPEPQKRLAKAEQYCQKALDLLPTIPKLESLTDAQFQQAKNQVSAMAYSGLGTVAFRRGKFAEAIPNFEQALKVDTQQDPVNYYLLGICDEKASHFDDAVTAFTKCAAIPGPAQATCTHSID